MNDDSDRRRYEMLARVKQFLGSRIRAESLEESMFRIFGLIFLIVLFTASGLAQEMRLHSDKVNRFSISYPAAWIHLTPSNAQTALKVADPRNGGFTDFNINVRSDASATEGEIKALVRRPDIYMSIIQRAAPDAKLLASGIISLDGHAAFWVKYAATAPNSVEEGARMTAYQVITVSEGYVYTLTFRARAGDFAAAWPTFDSMIKSFTTREKVAPTGTSNFVKLNLPLNVSIEVPKNWWLVDLNEEYKTSVETAIEAGLKLQGLDLPTGKKTNLFRANSMPRTTYASIAINATDSELDPSLLRQASNAEIQELSREFQSMFAKQFETMGVKLLEFYGVRREFFGKHPALIIRYKRSGLNGPVIFQMTRLFLGTKEISVNLAYRESETFLWKPVIDYMQSSFSVAS